MTSFLHSFLNTVHVQQEVHIPGEERSEELRRKRGREGEQKRKKGENEHSFLGATK